MFARDLTVEIILVSRDNFVLYTPMLAEVVSGSIEAKHVISPLREYFSKVTFMEAEVKSVDISGKSVTIYHWGERDTRTIFYDYLVLSLGSETNYYGLPGVEVNSFPFKTIADAMDLRNHVIDMFERADMEAEVPVRQRFLTFVVAGGGFAGVEVTAELNDFIRTSRRFYHNVRAGDIKLVLIVSGKRIMPEMNEDLAAYALKKLRGQGIEVYLGRKVSSTDAKSVELDNGDIIYSETLIWTAGIMPSNLISSLPCAKDRKGRIVVNGYLKVPELDNVWAIGDCADIHNPEADTSCPPTAQHALREGHIAANNIAAELKGGNRLSSQPFRYSSQGTLVPLGYRNAVAQIRGFRFSGFFAWWLWRTIYLIKLPDMYCKVRVALDWTLDLFFPRDIVQLRVVMKNRSNEKGDK